MREVFKISFFLLLIFGVGVKGNAQTYTFDLARPNCNGAWLDGDCWNRQNNIDVPTGCFSSPADIPTLSGGTGTCQRFVVVTGNVTLLGNVTLGGPLNEIEVRDGATLTITGNVVIQANQNITLETINGGNINILGTSGIALSAGASTVLNINGDNTGGVTTPTMNLANDATIQVNDGGRLNISGNLIQTGQTTGNINISGGQVNVGGSYILNQGNNSTPKTVVNANITDNGSLNVTGLLDMQNDTRISISGDNSGTLEIGSIDLGQRAIIDVLEGGRLVSNGDTKYSGNNSEINVSGYFNTQSVTVTGGSGKQLNVNGNGNVLIEGDVTIGGTAQITFGGNSSVYIEGDVIASGSDKLIIRDNAKVAVCGEDTDTDPPPAAINKEDLVECLDPNNCPDGGYYVNCRVLPVDYTHFEVVQSPNRASTLLKWTTAKEENNAYFEVERSLAGIQDFKVIGQVPGMGWTDAPSEYTFEDRSLPLAGGDVFYRLRQVDFDGKYSLSKVIKVRVQGVNSTRGIWRVHPNPVAGESPKLSLVEATAYTDGPIQIRLIHVSSVTQKADLQGIDQLNESFPSLFAKMPNGLILLEISWVNQVEQIKIMKK
jgi:hypothetical protein